jgi:hypothetical protein
MPTTLRIEVSTYDGLNRLVTEEPMEKGTYLFNASFLSPRGFDPSWLSYHGQLELTSASKALEITKEALIAGLMVGEVFTLPEQI